MPLREAENYKQIIGAHRKIQEREALKKKWSNQREREREKGTHLTKIPKKRERIRKAPGKGNARIFIPSNEKLSNGFEKQKPTSLFL